MIRFHAPDLESTGRLPEGESRHAVSVLRLREGDMLWAVDGLGHAFRCALTLADARGAGVEILERVDEPPHWHPRRLTVAVAPTKNADRMEWLLEKLVEIGIDRFVPLLCDRSERRKVNHERLERVAVSAMKQSLKATLPAIEPLTPLRRFVEGPFGTFQGIMGYCDPALERRRLVDCMQAGVPRTVVLIGPEGDFSPAEVEAALAAGFTAATFGDSRLRTETAALYGATAFHIIGALAQ